MKHTRTFSAGVFSALIGVATLLFTPVPASAIVGVNCANTASCGSPLEYCQKDNLVGLTVGYCALIPEGFSQENLPNDEHNATASSPIGQNSPNANTPPASSGASGGTTPVPQDPGTSASSAEDSTEGKASVSAEDFSRQGTITLSSPVSCQGDSCSIPQLIARIIQYLLGFIGALAVLMIVVGGIMYMASGGSTLITTKAKKTISYTIVGLVIAFLALFIVRLVLQILGAA